MVIKSQLYYLGDYSLYNSLSVCLQSLKNVTFKAVELLLNVCISSPLTTPLFPLSLAHYLTLINTGVKTQDVLSNICIQRRKERR